MRNIKEFKSVFRYGMILHSHGHEQVWQWSWVIDEGTHGNLCFTSYWTEVGCWHGSAQHYPNVVTHKFTAALWVLHVNTKKKQKNYGHSIYEDVLTCSATLRPYQSEANRRRAVSRFSKTSQWEMTPLPTHQLWERGQKCTSRHRPIVRCTRDENDGEKVHRLH